MPGREDTIELLSQLVLSETRDTKAVKAGGFAKTAYSMSRNFEKAEHLLKNLPDAVRKEITEEALYAGAKKAATVVRQTARSAFDTQHWKKDRTRNRKGQYGYGGLYGTIKAKKGKPEYYPSAYMRVGGKGGGHANWIEYGTKWMKRARPFIRRGLASAQAAQQEAILKVARARMPKATREAQRVTERMAA